MKRLLLIALALFAAPIYSQTLNFTVETTTSNGASVTPRLTWTSAPAGAVCTASALPAVTGWSGSKLSSGTQILPAISATNSYSLNCNWPGVTTSTVTCTAPTTHVDGTPLTELGSYRIDYGRSATSLDTAAYTTTPVCNWTSPTLAPGVWYFAVRAVKTNGLESDPSNITTKTITAAATQARTLEVAVVRPSPPTGAAAN